MRCFCDPIFIACACRRLAYIIEHTCAGSALINLHQQLLCMLQLQHHAVRRMHASSLYLFVHACFVSPVFFRLIVRLIVRLLHTYTCRMYIHACSIHQNHACIYVLLHLMNTPSTRSSCSCLMYTPPVWGRTAGSVVRDPIRHHMLLLIRVENGTDIKCNSKESIVPPACAHRHKHARHWASHNHLLKQNGAVLGCISISAETVVRHLIRSMSIAACCLLLAALSHTAQPTLLLQPKQAQL